jgi:SAM-dependent methyltransferase
VSTEAVAPNHHADRRAFTGLFGVVAALTMIGGREPDSRLAAELADVQPNDAVVDIGCGTGAAARFAADRGATVTAVDPAHVMRRIGGWLTRNKKVSYVDGTAESLPVPDASANVVWSIATVHHWHNIDDGLREVARVLVPGGRFVAIEKRTTPGAHGLGSHGWTEAQGGVFADRLRDVGFVDVRVETNKHGRHPALCVVAAKER